MAALRDALADPAVGCVVATGLGGVGKTSLAQHFVATIARSMFDESAWIDARDLPTELGRVAKRFGWRHEERLPTVDEASGFLREALAARRVLLVIDNVDPGLAEIRGFPIPGGASRTVITSRIVTLHEDLGRLARPLRLGTWDEAACRAHFRQVVPALASEPDETLDLLARKVGGLPLAVRLLAKQLLRPDVTVKSLLARVDREPIAALDAGARGVERTVLATFHASVEGLGKVERRALVALAACAPATRAPVVAAVTGTRDDEALLALTTLAEQSLVEWIEEADRPFRLHDVMRMLLRGEPDAAAAEAVHAAWTGAYVDAHRESRAWKALEHELPEVLAVVDRHLREADADGAFGVLRGVVALLDRRGMYGDLLARAGRILAAASPRGPTAAAVLGVLGLAWSSLGDTAKARDLLDAIRSRSPRSSAGPRGRRVRSGASAAATPSSATGSARSPCTSGRHRSTSGSGCGICAPTISATWGSPTGGWAISAPRSSTWSAPSRSRWSSASSRPAPRCSAASASASATSARPRARSTTSAAPWRSTRSSGAARARR